MIDSTLESDDITIEHQKLLLAGPHTHELWTVSILSKITAISKRTNMNI